MGENTVTALALKWQYEGWDWSPTAAANFAKGTAERIRVSAPEVSQPSTATEPAWLAPTRDQMLSLQGLSDNWDDRGSAEVRKDVISFAGSMLSSIMSPTAPAPAIVPLGHGGVQLMWQNDAVEIEVEVISPNHVVAYRFDKATGDEQEDCLTSDFLLLADVLSTQFQK
jgi:hypothetical protein